MNKSGSINVAVAELSPIVRTGVIAVLKRMPKMQIAPVEITSLNGLESLMEGHQPDVLIVDPLFERIFDVEQFREQYPQMDMKIVSLQCTVASTSMMKGYDANIGLFDSLDDIQETLEKMLSLNNGDSDQETLTQREKEVICCIVRGMTNKEIADKLFLSIHTVITHRRNIARKLQIHSAAGLTIYAIVNKLVDVSEVKL
ncbi:response regulator transcription factor [Phocaeicola oris]|uniref:response regulator transcription factor n=1 Tax=Phocaeicola oris TaxID=2896850 RepID=UPI00234EF2A6|nr:response regulator transcription factor [Phocaeicola oris]MCE2616520.1 response regulator transcription factor [Phocaeicola oris]